MGKFPLRIRLYLIIHFHYLNSDITFDVDHDVDHKLAKFQSSAVWHNSSTIIKGNKYRDSEKMF